MPAAPSPTAAAPEPAAKLSGPQRALRKLGLERDIDLALHLPLRYEDETRVTAIADARDGEPVQVQARVVDCRIESRARRQLVVRVQDDNDELILRFLHFYPSQQKALAAGQLLRVRGEIRHGFFGREMVHPAFRPVSEDTPLPSTLSPVYPTSAQLPQAYLGKAISGALARVDLSECLPAAVLPAGLPALAHALRFLHRPPASTALSALEERSHPAWQRLKFDELLAQQLSQLRAQAERARLRAPPLRADTDALPRQLRDALPFALTGAQERVVREIGADLQRTQPMHRLLQGDVGSGKTVVAALAAAQTLAAGWQCALMAPTEILAEQHFGKLVQWLEPLGIDVAWLSGGRSAKARREALERIASGAAGLVVGTHAVIQDDVQFARLGLAVIDEQHRFGVQQRLALRAKLVDAQAQAREPHLLMMSATPIPRTLAMSYYADLDVSTLDELPPGRTPVVTKVFADNRRGDVIARVQDEIARGAQAYWVCPLIEESEEGAAGAPTTPKGPGGVRAREALALSNVTATHAELSALLGADKVGLLHGRLRAADKAAVMARFVAGELRLLVTTTVIEVGVDVANASLMVIEHAERFGLSQLHQLRGRVGRGAAASVCVLLYTAPLSDSGKARLRTMAETADGFEIARRDLEIRGPGEFMGSRQSGEALLRFADLAVDTALLEHARRVAPELLAQHPQAAAAHVARWLGGRSDYLKA